VGDSKHAIRFLLFGPIFLLCVCARHTDYNIYTGKNTPLKTDRIRQIGVENGELLWAGTFGDGLYRVSGDAWQKAGEPFSATYVFAVERDRHGGWWIGTARNGAFYYRDGSWRHYTPSDGLTDNNVWCMLIDRSDNVWLGSRYHGVCILGDGKSTQLTTNDGLPDNQITAIAQDNTSRIWIGTARAGMCSYKDGEFTLFSRQQGLSGNYIRAIICDTTARWVGSWDGGLDLRQDSVWKKQEDVKPPVVAVEIDSKARLWVGTWGHGVYIYGDSGWKNITSANSSLPNDQVIDIVFDSNGKVYLATSKGLFVGFEELW
jgi:ligand-binding sensor domain-containing protein